MIEGGSEGGGGRLTPEEFMKRVQPPTLVDHPLERSLASAQSFGLADNLRRQLQFLGPRGRVVEIEALGYKRNAADNFPKTRAAHAVTDEDVVALCAEADEWLAQGIYLLHARLKEGVETRHANPGHWFDIPKAGGTTDSDVEARLILAVDFDVDRPTGTSATDEELKRAILAALQGWQYLAGAFGGTDAMAYIHSGNGRQIHIALDEFPNDDKHKVLLGGLLVGLDTLLSTPTVKIDRKLYDAKRILPACGTVKKKGSPGIDTRPHRRTAIVTPKSVQRLSYDTLHALAHKIWNDTSDAGRQAMNQAFGIRETVLPMSPPSNSPFGAANAVPPEEVAQWLGLYDSTGVVRCPGCDETSGVAVLQFGLKCHHNRCSGRGRNGFRTNVDLVAEVRSVTPVEAVILLAERFTFDTSGLGPPQVEAAPTEAPYTPPYEAPSGEAPPFPGVKSSRVVLNTTVEILAPLPPTRWLVPSLHLVAGRPTLLAGYGFSGKTLMAQAFAIAMAAAAPIWGKFKPEKTGRVLHLDYEQGKHATFKRYQRLMLGHEILRDEIGDRLQTAIFPEVYLDDRDATDVYARLCENVDVVVLDALRGATPTLDENDSTIRRCIDNLSRVSEKVGTAFIILHHAGKTARDDPRAQPRGSSAIFDASGGVFVVNGERNGPKQVQQTKSPAEAEGGALDDFYLVVEDVPDGERLTAGLKIVVQDTAQAKATMGPSGALTALKKSILEVVRDNVGLRSKNSICLRVTGGQKQDRNAAIDELVDEGLLSFDNGIYTIPKGTNPGVASRYGTGTGGTDTQTVPVPVPFLKNGTAYRGHDTHNPETPTVGDDQRRQDEAGADADRLVGVAAKERTQWCLAQGWTDARTRRAKAVLGVREKQAAKDADELAKMAAVGLDPEARATELGWTDARIRAAVACMTPRKETPSAPAPDAPGQKTPSAAPDAPPDGSQLSSAPPTRQQLVDALVASVGLYPKILKDTLRAALERSFGPVEIDELVEEALQAGRIKAQADNGMRAFVLADAEPVVEPVAVAEAQAEPEPSAETTPKHEAELLSAMEEFEQKEYVAAQRWSKEREEAVAQALQKMQRLIISDAKQLEKEEYKGHDPNAWAIEQGWSTRRIKAATLKLLSGGRRQRPKP